MRAISLTYLKLFVRNFLLEFDGLPHGLRIEYFLDKLDLDHLRFVRTELLELKPNEKKHTQLKIPFEQVLLNTYVDFVCM